MSKKFLIIDPEKCTGCRQCEIVCSVKHVGVSNPGRSSIYVIKRNNEDFYIPVHCQHCEDAPCIELCPREAISRDEKLNMVMVNKGLCIGCRKCIAVCPFGAVTFDTIKSEIVKCDLCGGDPECVHFCESGAIEYLEEYKIKLVQARQAASRMLMAAKK